MATEKILRGLLLIVSPEIGEVARNDLAMSGVYRVKAVTAARQALASMAEIKPYAVVVQNGLVPVPAMQAVRNMAELTASRRVPVIVIGGPLDETQQKMRDSLGIDEVIDGEYDQKRVLEAVNAAIGKIDKRLQDSRMRNQIRQRLKTASDRYATLTEEAARLRLNSNDQDFASDEVAPPAEEDKSKPPDEPTWDGSRPEG